MAATRRLNAHRRASPVRALLERAEVGDLDAAQVLSDLLIESGYEDAGGALAHALAGRTYPAGDLLPAGPTARNIRVVLMRVRGEIVPLRRRACMPSRPALAALLTQASRTHRWGAEYDVRRVLRQLWDALRLACKANTLDTHEHAMELANEAIGGHGVESLDVPTRRGGTPSAQYVNVGDPYIATLIWDRQDNRYRIGGWADVVERWERRWGRVEE